MLRLSALAPDGSAVNGFRFEGAAAIWEGHEPVEAGIRVERDSAGDRRPALARPGRLLRREPPGRKHAPLSALHARSPRPGADGIAFMVVPCGSLRDPCSLRARRRARDAGAEPDRAGRGRLRAPRRPARDLARFSLSRGASSLQRQRYPRAARRADASLAARGARRALVPGRRRGARGRASRPRHDDLRGSELGLHRGGGRVERLGALALALPLRSGTPDGDGCVRPRRLRCHGRPRQHARLVGERHAVRPCAPPPRTPDRQRGLRRRGIRRPRPCGLEPHARRNPLGAVDVRARLDDGLAPRQNPAALPHAGGCDALPPPLGRALARGRPLEPGRRPPRPARRRRAAGGPPRRDGRGRLLGRDGWDGLDSGARRGRPPRRGASGRRILQALRHLVRSAGGRRSRSDLRGRLCGGDGLRRPRGLGDGASGGRLDAHLPLHLRRRLLEADAARPLRLPDARRRPGIAVEPASARVRADLPARDAAARGRDRRRVLPTDDAREPGLLPPVRRARGRRLRRATAGWSASATTRPTASRRRGCCSRSPTPGASACSSMPARSCSR